MGRTKKACLWLGWAMKLFRAIGRTRSNRVQKRLKYEGFGSFHGENVEKMLLSVSSFTIQKLEQILTLFEG